MSHYEEMYKALLQTYELTAKQYEAVEKKLSEAIFVLKTNADAYERCLKNLEEKIEVLEQENRELRSRIKVLGGEKGLV